MKNLFTIVAAALLATGALVACGEETKSGDVHASPSSLEGKAKEAMDSTKATFEKMKTQGKKALDMQLADLDKKIQELKDKASKATGVEKEDLDKAVAQIDEKRKAAVAKLGEWKDKGADQWNDFASGTSQTLKDLHSATQKALSGGK